MPPTILRMGACAALAFAAPAHAAIPDCPLARETYSSRTLLSDLLADPRAKAILEQEAPSVMGPVTGAAGFKLPPAFTKIITPDKLLALTPAIRAQVTARLDARLAQVPLTPAVMEARCVGYDHVPPRLPATIAHPALLVFDKITGFRDSPSVDAATAALKAMAARQHWSITFSDKGAIFNARDLRRFDAVVWNNVSGDALTLPQRAAFRTWIEHGGGFVGIHGAGGDPVYIWDWYADTLVGARFIGHPAEHQFQSASVIVDDPASAITKPLGAGWTMTEEWYSFQSSPRLRGAHILARLDESTYQPVGIGGTDLRMGDHPIAWTQCIGDGRSFYTAIGHRPENYQEPHSLALLERGIGWAIKQGASHCVAGKETTHD